MDLGREIPSGPEMSAAPSMPEKRVSYPGFTLNDEVAKTFCAAHTCELGTEFTAKVKLKVTSLRKDEYGHSLGFDVEALDGIATPEKEDDSEEKSLGYKRPKSKKEAPNLSAKDLT